MTYLIPDYLQEMVGGNDYLKITFTGRSLKSIGSYVRSSNTIQGGSRVGRWEFIAPNEIMEDVSHDWEEFESLAQRTGQKYVAMKHAGAEFVGMSAAAGSLANSKSNVATSLGKVKAPEHKVDATLVYKTSHRKKYSLEFEINFYRSSDPKRLIFQPIRELEKCSCADFESGSFTKIDFPAVFTIKSEPNKDLINIKYAALTAVQPTWMAPYINGYPSRVRLTISFVDIKPLYKKSFEDQ